MFDKKMLLYENIAEFNRQFYKDLLTSEHVVGPQIRLSKLIFEDGEENEAANFFGYVLEKDKTKYLLNSKNNGEEICLSKVLPIKPTQYEKVADSKGNVYLHIKSYAIARLPSRRTMSFKELMDRLTGLEHTNKQHQRLLAFMGVTQMYDRANFRVASPAGMGKDSIVDILGNLIGGCTTIESPTFAKLEERASACKWLAVNEVVDIGTEQWDVIQQFLLATGAHKPVVTKHSRAFKNVGEMIDISNFSISLFYNDYDHYPNAEKKYFDVVVKKAVSDRFPAFRLWGGFSEDFNAMKNVGVSKFVEEHFDDYRELICNFIYYRDNYHTLLHGYQPNNLMGMSQRWETNVGRLLKVVDLYCDTREEYDEWVKVINDSIEDYMAMKEYQVHLDKLIKKFGDVNEQKYILKNINTYKEKNNYINKTIKGEKIYIDTKSVWDFDKKKIEEEII